MWVSAVLSVLFQLLAAVQRTQHVLQRESMGEALELFDSSESVVGSFSGRRVMPLFRWQQVRLSVTDCDHADQLLQHCGLSAAASGCAIAACCDQQISQYV